MMASLMKLSKLNCSDQNFYLLSKQSEDKGIDLTLSDGVKSWIGKITEVGFATWSEKTKLKLSDYKVQTMKALSGESVDGTEFEHEVKLDGNGSANLIWKRVLEDKDIKFQLGCVTLRPDSDQARSISRMLDSSIRLTSTLKDQIQSLRDERGKLVSERSAAIQRLDKYVSLKEDIERDLYAKFVVILNHKKKKIQELTEQTENIQPKATNSAANATTSSVMRTLVSSKEDNFVMTSECKTADSDMEYDTDDELKQSTSSSNSTTVRETKEKVAALENDEAGKMEEDLLLDEGPDDDLPSVPRRTRRREVLKKLPSKPVIPQVGASEQSETSRKNLSRRSSAKGRSHKQDTNDLIDDMD